MKLNTNPVRGTVDYLPKEMEVISYAKNIILETYKKNGFLEIKTPILENLDLLTSGDSGDNQKLMFKTVKRGHDLNLTKENLSVTDITEEGLRYDLTVPLVRCFANNREKLPFPFKAIQIDEAFRAERPQKGRVREFTQCDIDILGDSSINAEIDLLVSGLEAYEHLGFNRLTVRVNDRRILNELIVRCGFDENSTINICISLDKFDKIGFSGVEEELIKNGYEENKVKTLTGLFERLKSSASNEESYELLKSLGISSEVIANVAKIISTVQKFAFVGFKIVYDPAIIRGQGYYTGTVYEIYDDDFGRAIGGGGRYDHMVEKMIGVSVPAVGFSIGFYSVTMLMAEKNIEIPTKKLALVYKPDDSFEKVLEEKQKFKHRGYEVSVFAFPKNFNNFAEKLKNNGYKLLVKMSNTEDIVNL